jgi:preprotein translocase subunit SecG
MHMYSNWKEERYNFEDSIGAPFMQFMTAVVAIVFFCVLLENFAIYSTNIKKEEKPEEFQNVEKLE